MNQTKNQNNTGIIVLAAGASTRMGKPKQLLQYNGGSLLQHSLNAANHANAQPVIVVLGAWADRIKNEMKNNTEHIIMNAEWNEGMASSIRCGIKALMETNPAAEGAILMVCDQPFVTSSLLNELITTHQKTGKPIVACSYADTFGPPVFFHKTLFSELMQLKGDVGARSVIQQHANDVEVILFAKGNIDVDTAADYEKLSEEQQ